MTPREELLEAAGIIDRAADEGDWQVVSPWPIAAEWLREEAELPGYRAIWKPERLALRPCIKMARLVKELLG